MSNSFLKVDAMHEDVEHERHISRVIAARLLATAQGHRLGERTQNLIILGPDTQAVRTLAARARGFKLDRVERGEALGDVWLNELPGSDAPYPDIIAVAGWGYDELMLKEAAARYAGSVLWVDLAYLDRALFQGASWCRMELDSRLHECLDGEHPGLNDALDHPAFVAAYHHDCLEPEFEAFLGEGMFYFINPVHHMKRLGAQIPPDKYEFRNESSFLTQAGYRTGRTRGLEREARREILDILVRARGLQELAIFLNWLVEDSKRRPSMLYANADRIDDLDYLKSAFWSDDYSVEFPCF